MFHTTRHLCVQLTNVYHRFKGPWAELTACYILKDAQSPVFVGTQKLWPASLLEGLLLKEHLWLMNPTYPWCHGLAYLLFNEGQDSYEDHCLWNDFFKEVADGGHPITALSCFAVMAALLLVLCLTLLAPP